MRRITILATLIGLALALPAGASADSPELRGTVVSVDRGGKTFQLRDHKRGTVRVQVTRRTDFEDIAGFSALHRGMAHIEVEARRSRGHWVAKEIERSGSSRGRDDDHHRGDDDDDDDDSDQDDDD